VPTWPPLTSVARGRTLASRRGDIAIEVLETIRALLGKARATPTKEAIWARIAADGDGSALRPGQEYFEVRVERIKIANEREWLSQYAPVAMAAAEFSYAGESVVVPTVIGPQMIEKLGMPAPDDAVIANTRVAGPHPLHGQVTVSVVLHRVERGKIYEPLLSAIEGASTALELAAGIVPYANVARVVLSEVGAVTGGDRPLLGRRDEFQPVEPGIFALIDPDANVDKNALSVEDRTLHHDGEPLEGVDYVLYSISRGAPEDVDVTRLPFQPLWRSVLDDAAKSALPQYWDSAKANMAALMGMLYTSNDLTPSHRDALISERIETVKALHEQVVGIGVLSGDLAQPALDEAHARSLAMLEL